MRKVLSSTAGATFNNETPYMTFNVREDPQGQMPRIKKSCPTLYNVIVGDDKDTFFEMDLGHDSTGVHLRVHSSTQLSAFHYIHVQTENIYLNMSEPLINKGLQPCYMFLQHVPTIYLSMYLLPSK